MKKLTVEFSRIGPGKCRWCRKEKDRVITLAFSDGSFVGNYCQADFMKALEDKLEADPSANGVPKAVPVGESLSLSQQATETTPRPETVASTLKK